MKVAQLIEALKAQNQDAEVRIGMWYGPGSPSWVDYDVAEVRCPKMQRDSTENAMEPVRILANEPRKLKERP